MHTRADEELIDIAMADGHASLPRLEYVTSPGCSDCRAFDTLIKRVARDHPQL